MWHPDRAEQRLRRCAVHRADRHRDTSRPRCHPELAGSETSLESRSITTFDFESGLEGWQLVQGTFQRSSTGGGAQGSTFHIASSESLANQCDAIRSPLLRLTPTSTMSMWTNFDIEPSVDIEGITFWFDRANVGVHDVVTGRRTPLIPDSGRSYTASGSDGTCGTRNQEGWAGAATTWAASTW